MQMQGIVKEWDINKGYGYIVADNIKYFCHFTSIQAPGVMVLSPGARVEFEATTGQRGAQASLVKIL